MIILRQLRLSYFKAAGKDRLDTQFTHLYSLLTLSQLCVLLLGLIYEFAYVDRNTGYS